METTKLSKRILLVDDDPEWLEILKNYLDGFDFKIHTARDGVEAELLLLKNEFDLVILDTNMPRMNGIELLKIIRILFPTLPAVVFFSGLAGSTITADKVLAMGASAVLEKVQAESHLKLLVTTLLLLQDINRHPPPKTSSAFQQNTPISPRLFKLLPENMRG